MARDFKKACFLGALFGLLFFLYGLILFDSVCVIAS
jgi:hypothetical protein